MFNSITIDEKLKELSKIIDEYGHMTAISYALSDAGGGTYEAIRIGQVGISFIQKHKFHPSGYAFDKSQNNGEDLAALLNFDSYPDGEQSPTNGKTVKEIYDILCIMSENGAGGMPLAIVSHDMGENLPQVSRLDKIQGITNIAKTKDSHTGYEILNYTTERDGISAYWIG